MNAQIAVMPKPTDRPSGRSSLRAARKALRDAVEPGRAASSAWFFKTGPGQYGEGDRFLGVRVPAVRAIARSHEHMALPDLIALLGSSWHEERLLALLIMVHRHERGSPAERSALHDAYLANVDRVNNWDLVDTSAPTLVGAQLDGRPWKPLLAKLSRSPGLWERRIAMIATLHFTRTERMEPALTIARRLLDDREDLIHKAVGWMLREVGKRDVVALRAFLDEHADGMPRTALRYAIERLPRSERQRYMAAR